MKRLVQRAARRVGLDVLSLDYSRDYIYDHHLREMLARHGIETVLDIDANIDGFGTFLRKVGFTRQIISFEPVAEPYRQVKALADRDANWITHQFAFSEFAETKSINIMAGSELCSFLPPAEQSKRMTCPPLPLRR